MDASRSFGRIVNIGLGGMKFHYLNWDRSTPEEGELDIYLDGEDILQNIPFRVLPKVQEEKHAQDETVVLRECRVQFKELSKAQQGKLEHFIYHQTAGKA